MTGDSGPFSEWKRSTALGLRHDALRRLREAIDARDFRMPMFAVTLNTEFDALKDDPEFQKLIGIIRRPATGP